MEDLLISLIAGVFGAAYIIYGKKQAKFSALFAGIALCVYPYFIDSVLWECVIGAGLLAVPFLVDY